jgi:hypothetical protein
MSCGITKAEIFLTYRVQMLFVDHGFDGVDIEKKVQQNLEKMERRGSGIEPDWDGKAEGGDLASDLYSALKNRYRSEGGGNSALTLQSRQQTKAPALRGLKRQGHASHLEGEVCVWDFQVDND